MSVLFIPLSDHYRVFQALRGWTRDFNAYTVAKTLRAPRMPEGLARAICILAVVSIIPFFGIATSIANVIFDDYFCVARMRRRERDRPHQPWRAACDRLAIP